MNHTLKIPIAKRVFDITITSLLLLFLSPIFLLTAVLVMIESRGPVFYYSNRVGMGYHLFKFYKFRSMRKDADSLIESVKHLNQYAKDEKTAIKEQKFSRRNIANYQGKGIVLADNKIYNQKAYDKHKTLSNDNSFLKIKDDPRITRVGKFIRNTSIDELPQLFNILKGDMSLVGNRPLPLYEAEN